ncbi:MAG: T9SS type B sorting domain-containing protein, partial [Saprospiraceae bacterium]|nr:T9SS type B sorting domain-containing protein [Saprospiraceae bacterium]
IVQYIFQYADTLYTSQWTCDPGEVGISNTILSSNVCDTLEIVNTQFYDCAPTLIDLGTCDPDSVGTFVDTLQNQVDLDSIIITSYTLNPTDTMFTFSSSCNPLDTGMTILTFVNQSGCESYEFNYTSLIIPDTLEIIDYSCDPDVWTDTLMVFTNTEGCDSMVYYQILPSSPVITILEESSCLPEEAGLDTLGFFQTETGCDSIIILETIYSPLEFTLELEEITCQQETGMAIISTFDGQAPFLFGVEDEPLSDNPIVTGLGPGNHMIMVEDANGCVGTEEIYLTEPFGVDVELGDDIEIDLGESAQLSVLYNQPLDTFFWEATAPLTCMNCLDPETSPMETAYFTLTVIDENGCEATDRVTVFVRKDQGVYIPNVFSPNGDGAIESFTVFANESVEKIELIIADRWGEIVFQHDDLIPGDLEMGWDGTLNGVKLNPAVFVYMAKVRYVDGRQEILKGDITLIR